MELPVDFKNRMQELLGTEFSHFINSYQKERNLGLRTNTLKISLKDWEQISPFGIEKIPWANEGYFYNSSSRPGKHPYHEAGLYYIQEPSAMAAGEILGAKPGERVLDLCAAPGGKTTHLAEKMQGKGLLVSNEWHPKRASILSHNVERMGIKNVIVTNESVSNLAVKFPEYFDRILVDAPCSGEGMFRKEEKAVSEWSILHVRLCAQRQKEILERAESMLKPGGTLLYSTCTFSPEENEGVIDWLLKEKPYMQIKEAMKYKGFSDGRNHFMTEQFCDDLKQTIRLWPHKIRGEGHFIALLQKKDGFGKKQKSFLKADADKNSINLFNGFIQSASGEKTFHTGENKMILFGEQLYLAPKDSISLEKCKVLRPGLHLGTIIKRRFEPSHALALALKDPEYSNTVSFPCDSKEMLDYLSGNMLDSRGKDGWCLVEADGYTIGWGKRSGTNLKNHYPKGLRWQG